MPDEHGLDAERCVIERWRGYRSSTFFVSFDGETAFLESRAFPWRKAEPPPDSGRPRKAFDELVSALESRGWHRDGGTAGAWYAARFVRVAERRSRTPVVPTRVLPDPEPEPEHVPTPAAEPAEQWLDSPPAPAQMVAEPVEPVLPVADEPVAPEPRPAKRSRRRRPRLIMVIAVLGLCVTVGSLALGAAGLGSKHSRTILVPVASAAPAKKTAPKPVATPEPTTTAAPVRHERLTAAARPAHAKAAQHRITLSISATTSSWLEVRRGSATGRVVYAGNLDPGRVIRVHAPRIWARFGAAGNLVVHVDGRRVNLMGTLERVFGR